MILFSRTCITMWFIVALAGYFLLSVVLVMDKFILSKSVRKPAVYTFYSTFFFFALLLGWPLGAELLAGGDWVWAIISGLAFGFALWTMFLAVGHEEASRVNPFIGSIVTISTVVLASLFLHEVVTRVQLLGIVILFLSTLLFVFSQSSKAKRWNKGLAWGILAGMFFALSHTSAKYIYEAYPFLTALVWTKASVGLVGVVILLFPAVRKEIFTVKPRKANKRQHVLTVVGADKVIGLVGTLLVQYAIAIGSVSLVNAMIGIQYAFLFIIIVLLTRFAPRVFKETITRREYIMETLAIVFVALGSALFVFS